MLILVVCGYSGGSCLDSTINHFQLCKLRMIGGRRRRFALGLLFGYILEKKSVKDIGNLTERIC